jgi:hypothetical protein
VLKTDGHIGAVLHINPDDNPTAGSPTDYVLSFSDDTGRFSLPKCDCSVSIIKGGKTIAAGPLTASGSELSEDRYTFSTPAVYTMHLDGKPKTPGAFQPFTLNYEIRVTGNQTAVQPMPVLLWVGMGMTVGLILLASYVFNYTDSEQEVNNEETADRQHGRRGSHTTGAGYRAGARGRHARAGRRRR